MEFSADYPGAWQRAVEQATGGTAIFLAGAVGSHSPVPGAAGFDGVERMGKALAQAVLEQLPRTRVTNRIVLGAIGLDVQLPPLHARLTDGLRLRPWLARRLLPVEDHTFLPGFRLGDSVWISTPCDFSGELALDIKQALAVARRADCGHQLQRRLHRLCDFQPLLPPAGLRASAYVLLRSECARLFWRADPSFGVATLKKERRPSRGVFLMRRLRISSGRWS